VIPKNLNVNFGITEMIRAAGQNPGTSYLQVQRAEAEGEVATRLELPVGTPVIVVERVRTANGRPVVYSTDTFSQSLVGDADLDKGQLLNRSLYEILETDYGLVIEYGIAQVLPCKATRYIAKRLSIPVGSSLLFLRQTDYSPADRPVLHSLEYHLPDAFDFIIVRRGPAKL
jgi:DNA-binding GntR family transcriptional regulator